MLGIMSFSGAERSKLRDLFLALGPDAPTLCEGWTTRDLAVHLLVRETRPDAALGMFLPPARGHLAAVTRTQAARDYEDVVRQWGAGPGRFNPVRLVDGAMNAAEHFVHHEDVRRGGVMRGEPLAESREFSAVVTRQLQDLVARMAPLLLRKSRSSVVLCPPAGVPIVAARSTGVARRGDDVVRVSGEAGELLLWAFGRDAVRVSIEGDESAVVRSAI